MTDAKLTNLRGYDDTPALKDMADGMVVRRYTSVEEAAKAVLGEDSGSNVDRLRRKFREQGWYERGLNDYVEAEINRRDAEGTPKEEEVFLDHKGDPMSVSAIAVEKARRHLVRQFTPTGTLAFFNAVVLSLTVVVLLKPFDFEDVIGYWSGIVGMGLFFWADKASRTATPKQMAAHLAAVVVFGLSLCLMFRLTVSDPRFFTGSMPGAIAVFPLVMTVVIYLIGAMRSLYGRAGSGKVPELGVIAVLLVLGGLTLGIGPILNDLNKVNRQNVIVGTATTRIDKAIAEIRKDHPEIDVAPLEDVRRGIADDVSKVMSRDFDLPPPRK